MVDLRSTEEDKKDIVSPAVEAPVYPYGLRINFTPPVMKMLGIEKMDVGQLVEFSAVAEVISVRKEVDSNEKGNCVELQIKEIELESKKEEQEEKKEESSVSKFYGE